MHRLSALAFAFAMPLVFPLAVSAASRPMAVPADSFINLHVDSVPQLTQQVTLDPTVRRRLARHFHVSGPALVRYIQDNLVLRKTTRTGRYQVYCVSRTGREYTINARLPLGTPVFVLRTTGQPVLKLACGNPMAAMLPPVIKKAGSVENLPDLASLPTPVPAVPAKIAPELAPSVPVVVAAAGKPVVYVMPAPMTKIAGGLYELPAPSSHFPIGFLAGIPIIASLATHHGGGNNGNSGTNTGTGGGMGTGSGMGTTGGTNTGTNTGFGTNSGTNTGTGTSPVPEPSASAAFAIGGVGLAILLAGGRRRRRTR